ncbi:photosystem II assembly protein Psb34 [[Phormidium ambiguum] IAM M-71]|uniref:photosystem II assembly protein Psb34 n=1 Tax=[Phormidium ambiguum] IAM M-71 TaxID=454136 RepID=UPI001160F376|nr:ssl1498 family light-harvesting-like protein [Phormidium ambiguum]
MYTTDDRGVLNNYAAEPNVYYAEYPSEDQQQRYLFQGAVAVLFVSLLVLTAFGVS